MMRSKFSQRQLRVSVLAGPPVLILPGTPKDRVKCRVRVRRLHRWLRHNVFSQRW